MDKSAQDILKTIDDAITNFQSDIPDLQQLMLDKLQPIIKQFDVSGGKLLNNVNNLKLLGQLQNTLESAIINPDYKDAVKQFVDSFNDVSSLNNTYFSQFNQKFTPAKTLPLIKEQAVNATINDLVGQGLSANIIAPIQEILRQNITTGGSYTSLQQQLTDHITNNKTGEGSLQRYTKQITTDAINQYSAQYQQTIAQDLNFSWGMYIGSNIKTTRQFCRLLTQKDWVHKSELPGIIQGDIDGVQCVLSKTTKLPLGMILGTTADNFKIRRGGYNCGHQFFWVPDETVPAALLAKFGLENNVLNPVEQNTVVVANKTPAINIDKLAKDKIFTEAFNEFDKEKAVFDKTGTGTTPAVNLTGIKKYGLTDDEAKVLYAYTTSAYDGINKQLYSGKPSANVKSYESALNETLDKLPNYTGQVIRDYTPTNQTSAELISSYANKVGKSVTFDGFLSTSKDENFSFGGKVKYNITSKTGKLIQDLTSHVREQEVLFGSGTMFNITKVEGNTVYLDEV